MKLREISAEFTVQTVPSGNSMSVCRSIGSSRARALPPFVGCEQFWVDTIGNPPHPARGFQEITLLMSGRIKIEYSPPNIYTMGPRDVLSVMVGRGVRPKIMSLDGTSSGVQIWVDVPEEYKRQQPSSKLVQASESTSFNLNPGVAVTLLSGKAFGHTAANPLTITPVMVAAITVSPGASFEYAIPDHWNAFVYTTEGTCTINTTLQAKPHHYIEFRGHPKSDDSGLPIIVKAAEDAGGPASLILCSAESLHQPIFHQGPFVDVSTDWISQAYDDYNQRKNGFERHQMWNDHPE